MTEDIGKILMNVGLAFITGILFVSLLGTLGLMETAGWEGLMGTMTGISLLTLIVGALWDSVVNWEEGMIISWAGIIGLGFLMSIGNLSAPWFNIIVFLIALVLMVWTFRKE